MWFEIHASLYARRVKGPMQVSLEWTKRETYRDFPTTVTVLLKQMDQSCPTKSVTRVNENAACFTTVNSFMMWPKCCPNFVSLRRLFHYSDCHYADFYCNCREWKDLHVDKALWNWLLDYYFLNFKTFQIKRFTREATDAHFPFVQKPWMQCTGNT